MVHTASDSRARMLVTGTRGASAPVRWLLGSTADRVVRRSTLPVLVVREPADGLLAWSEGKAPLKVIMGLDFEESFEFVTAAAKRLLEAGPCEIHYVHSYNLPTSGMYKLQSPIPLAPAKFDEIEPMLAREVHRLVNEAGLPSTVGRVHLLQGRPAGTLTELATTLEAGLILVGTHARRGLERALLGSVALGVLHGSPCPVLVAPVT